MTGNKITLYKVPWAFGSIRQPYFLSDAARNNFFNGLTDTVQAVENGVGIKIGYNYEIECVCNIDITVAQDYNFGIVTYNNHDYYADIIDMEMVNVNRTRIQFKRNAIIENTNYLQHFKNFTISKMTLKSDIYTLSHTPTGVGYSLTLDQSTTKKFLFTDYFREYKRKLDIEILSHRPADGNWNNVVAFPCIVILATYEESWDSRNVAKYYGEPTGYRIGIIPLPYFNGPAQSGNSKAYVQDVRIRWIGADNPYDYDSHTYTIRDVQYPSTGVADDKSNMYGLLSKLSPYTCQAMFTKVLCFRDSDTGTIRLPYIYNGLELVAPEGSAEGAYCFWVENTTAYDDITFQPFNEDFYFDLSFDLDDNKVSVNYFKKLNFKFFNSSQEIEINVRDFIGKDSEGHLVCNVHCELKQIFSMLGTQLLVSFYSQSQSGSIENNKLVYSKVISFGDSTNITVEASANFNANNRYYMSMANNAIEQKQTAAFTQAIGQFATGATQLIGGFVMPASASVAATGSYGMGIGNIIRGITSTVQAHTDAAYERERARLYKKNEEAKPDTVEGNYSAASAFHSISVGFIACIEISPFEEDYKHWLNDSKIYGYECELFEQTLDVASLADGDNFALSAIAEVSDDTLSAREYSEMYEFLKQCNYKVYS